MARADIIFSASGAHLIVKWSKTMQNKDKVKILKIPSIPGSPLCPVHALQLLLKNSPGSNSPLFQNLFNNKWVPLTDSKLRKHFSSILKRLHLQHSGYTFHTFRRSGTTFAFNSNVTIQNIKQHGIWSSDCVYRYISSDINASEQVSDGFQLALAHTATN